MIPLARLILFSFFFFGVILSDDDSSTFPFWNSNPLSNFPHVPQQLRNTVASSAWLCELLANERQQRTTKTIKGHIKPNVAGKTAAFKSNQNFGSQTENRCVSRRSLLYVDQQFQRVT
jgi:hypothetical protein